MTGGDAERRELLDDVERLIAGDADVHWWRRAAEAGHEKAARALSQVEPERKWRHAAIVGSLSVGVVLTRLVAGRLRSTRIG